MKRCPKCETDKPLDAFQNNRATKDGLQAWCRLCRANAKNMRPGETTEVVRIRNGKTQVFVRGANHGESKTPLYRRWKSMKERCENPFAHNYKWYGGRGITVCEEWQEWPNFRDWANSSGYERHRELDRIDPNKEYSPENCQWISKADNIARRGELPEKVREALQREAEIRRVAEATIICESLAAYLKVRR